jgi:hypothetical protein
MNPGGFIFFRPHHHSGKRPDGPQPEKSSSLITNKLTKILLNKTVDNLGKKASSFGFFCRKFKNTRKRF